MPERPHFVSLRMRRAPQWLANSIEVMVKGTHTTNSTSRVAPCLPWPNLQNAWVHTSFELCVRSCIAALVYRLLWGAKDIIAPHSSLFTSAAMQLLTLNSYFALPLSLCLHMHYPAAAVCAKHTLP